MSFPDSDDEFDDLDSDWYDGWDEVRDDGDCDPYVPIPFFSGRTERERVNRELKRQGLEDTSSFDHESGMKRRRARRKGFRHERVRKDRRSRELERENSFSPDD